MNVTIVVYIGTIAAAMLFDFYLAVCLATSVPDAGIIFSTIVGLLTFGFLMIPTSLIVYGAAPVAAMIGLVSEILWWLGKKIWFAIQRRRHNPA